SNPFHPANVIYHKNHLRYRAATYAINPKGGDLYGEPVYRSLGEVPARVDLAVVAVRAEAVPGVLRECAAGGVKAAVVVSGGFAETGRQDLQDEIAEISRAHGLPLVGPNCLGVYAAPVLDTFFLPPERLIEIRPGDISLVSQSGGILVDLMIKLTQEGAGIARGLSIGNRAVLDEVDLVEFFLGDPATRVIGIYLEGFRPGRGRALVELLGRATKPVVFLKAGKSPGGTRAVASHTASVAGDYRVLRDILGHAGALEARDEAEFVAYCEALSAALPAKPLRNLAIVTASGGHGAVASDECQRAGLTLPELPADDQERLRAALSPSVRGIASVGNPVDLTGSAGDQDFLAALRFLLDRPYVDGAVLLLLPYLPALTPDVGARAAQVAQASGKP
ncbi:MAG: CoA-binding protein, partial [Candidatus Dadabacteria bacterium]